MKSTMRKSIKKVFATTLIAMMIISQTGFAFADTETENVPEAPVAPAAESHKDNDKITEYNNKVDSYNKAAESYNNAVDEEYEAAVHETATKNEEIAQHNAAEEQRVKDAQARNEQAQKEAEKRNAEIDVENAEGLAKAQKEAEEKYQSDLAKYAEDMKQYEKDRAQYEYDVNIEKQILNLGYSSVEHYNEVINTRYNEPAKLSVKKNAEAKELSAKDTYTVQEAAEKSGKMITVRVEHHFDGTDVSYVEEFQIDANDVITVKALGAAAEAIQPGYAAFYYNTDDSHQMGYWASSYSYVATNAKYNNSGWDHGDTHEISLKDGTRRAYDDDGITVEYYYSWIAQKVYKTYNTPSEPTAPTVPVKSEAVYEAIPYVTAEIEDIAAADIKEYLSEPVKKNYLEILTHLALFDVPEIVNAVTADSNDTTAGSVHKANAAQQTASAVQQEEISDELMPLAVSDANSSETLVAENNVPMADAEGFWALINLIAAALTVIMGALFLAANRRIRAKVFGIVAAITSAIIFILTEDMTLTMQLTDRWTVLMVAILAVEVLIMATARKPEDEEEENEYNEVRSDMVNA